MDYSQIIEPFLPLESAVRLLIATIAGGLIGWERERSGKPAGLRTHMLVALGAAAFMVSAVELSEKMGDVNPAIRLDPMRVLAGIIGGVGFLGAGTIIESRGSVRGITTAASIWISAAIGTCSGMGLYRLAFSSGILTLIVLWFVGRIEQKLRILKKKVTNGS